MNIDWDAKEVGAFNFPDGQPHIVLPDMLDRFGQPLEVRCRICSPLDLFRVGMLVEILKHKRIRFRLRIVYLMAGRMDRRLSDNEPYTLRAVAHAINGFGADVVSVFCPHSQSTSDLIENYDDAYFRYIEDDFYSKAIGEIAGYQKLEIDEPSLVFPDAGASKRFAKFRFFNQWPSYVILDKNRDERTGEILGIKIVSGKPKKRCIIVDDLCDGGRTFIEASKALRAAGAENVSLIVAHGIFSKGASLPGIDFIATTNSFYRGSDVSVFKLI